jgi:CheY-like chemotaxis protein
MTASLTSSSSPSSAAPVGHLLCIDDNPVNGLLMQEFFQLLRGVPVKVAMTGLEGLDMALSERPMAVLLDLVLPDISGTEVLRRLRQDPRLSDLPVAIVSGSVDGEEFQQVEQLGIQACWPKPLDFARLGTLLDQLLGCTTAA